MVPMNDVKKAAAEFVLQIKNGLVCADSEKNRITKDIENSILDYIEENGVTDISEVYRQFGTPQEICAQFNAEVEPKKIKKMLNIRKTVLVGVIVIVAMVALSLIITLIDAHKDYGGRVIDSEVEVVSSFDETDFQQ